MTMRVLHLAKFFPPFRGGMEKITWELVTGLRQRGLAADVLCANTRFRSVRETGPYGEAIVRAGSFGTLFSTPVAPALARELLRLHRYYDIIDVHLPNPTANLAMWLIRPRCKIVIHWHSDIVKQRILVKLYQPLQSWLMEQAKAIVVTSEAYRQSSPYLSPYLIKTRVIPLGIQDSERLPSTRLLALRERYRGRTIMFALGRMTYYKGFDVLIEAAQKLTSDTIVLVGGGGMLLDTYRKEVQRRQLNDRIEFLGSLSDIEVQELFQGCDIFCLPSIERSEAFGVVLLEAMSACRPVVATRIPGSGVAWVNEDGITGFNVPPCDSDALAAALQRLVSDRHLREKMGIAARERYEALFRSERMVELTIKLYQEV